MFLPGHKGRISHHDHTQNIGQTHRDSIALAGSTKITRRLARAQQAADIRICKDLVREIRSATRQINSLQREIAALVARAVKTTNLTAPHNSSRYPAAAR